ncbi:hypothetical protein SPRG_03098 [Saprolegnia parasitica CBS 223.65]|uniref:Uncharacterized protein n=1 Tax=Saprolegnia parasitica (strain CBS 223.65) TaxID=695850 RepID=A0A067CYK0_SAPPC|nr:hypothetical protein SPRG_03098 [Saprolegnia parasitica CBS 223.65]KDO31882.1 hypothetical protein SPRG_03098 [Saprolegnia parasitica CBS 223.65]|eukprot:XP_012197081.1 hypothetical protein SPRG_03098 [Saprolegnia parasitica CBS 223.65]
MPPPDGDRSSNYLLLWPKHRRVHIADVNDALYALEAAVKKPNATDLWGCDSVDAMAEMYLQEYLVRGCSLRSVQRLASVVVRLGSVALAQKMLSECPKSGSTVADVAPWVQQLLERFDALETFLGQVMQHTSLPLIASLTGVAATPMCPPLSTPCTRECVRWLLPRLHALVVPACDDDDREVGILNERLAWLLLIDTYVDAADAGQWFSPQLPRRAIQTINACIGASSAMLTMLQKQPTFEIVIPAFERALELVAEPYRPTLRRRLRYWRPLVDDGALRPRPSANHMWACATLAMLRYAHRMEPTRSVADVLSLCTARASSIHDMSATTYSNIYHLLKATFWNDYDDDVDGVLTLLRQHGLDRAIEHGNDAVDDGRYAEWDPYYDSNDDDEDEDGDDDEHEDVVASVARRFFRNPPRRKRNATAPSSSAKKART